jgi:glucose/arabinose dehydrogenase
MALDYSGSSGGREKLLPVHAGDDWGFPCCATTGIPYANVPAGTACGGVATELASFNIGESPFNIEFTPASWPAPWANQALVAMHGEAGSWTGARVLSIPLDLTTGLTVHASDLDGGTVGMTNFATGWDDGTLQHGRPAALAVAPDGRLFVGNDDDGVIFWVAPLP